MDLLEAIYRRKSVHKFTNEEISENILEMIRKHYNEMRSLSEGVKTDIEIINNRKSHYFKTGLFSSGAPYYIVFYSKDAVRAGMNVGFQMENILLYLCCLGLGTYIANDIKIPKKLSKKDDMTAYAVICFGKSKEPYIRNKSDAVRMSVVQLSVFQDTPREWIRRLVDAARFAPSYKNEQPWRFLIYNSEFHIYTSKTETDKMKRTEEVDFGAMLANIMTAADELWLDVDLIKLDNISNKNFKDSQYVISAVLKNSVNIY